MARTRTSPQPAKRRSSSLSSPDPNLGRLAWRPGLRLVLASGSPQRREILERLGVAFEIDEPGVDELGDGAPAAVALENARRKALAVRERHPDPDCVVLAADTVVALGDTILGKPENAADARASIAALAGSSHAVLGAIVLAGPGEQWREGLATSTVSFRPLGADEIADYVATGEWEGRAGGYAIQLGGAGLVAALEGERDNVVGLSTELLGTLVQGLVPSGAAAGDRYNP